MQILGVRTLKPKNRLTKYLALVIMLAISALIPKFITITQVGATWRMHEISPTRDF